MSVRDNVLGLVIGGIDYSLQIISRRIYHGCWQLPTSAYPNRPLMGINCCTMCSKDAQLVATVQLHIDPERKYDLVDISPGRL